MTNDLERRVWEHKTQFVAGSFTSMYDVTRLVYIEEYPRFDDAIAREKQLKGKSRAKKVALIESKNPRWNDLAWGWFDADGDCGGTGRGIEAERAVEGEGGRFAPGLNVLRTVGGYRDSSPLRLPRNDD